MYPNSSVCGIMIANHNSKYFTVTIDETQQKEYCIKRGFDEGEAEKWIVKNI